MEILYLSLLAFIGAGIGTLTGFGSSMVMLPVLVLFYPLPESLLLAGVVHIFNDIWKVGLFRGGINWRLILEFGIPGIIFAFIGGNLALDIPEHISGAVLGSFFIGYVIFLLLHPHFEIKHKDWTAGVGGAISGFSAGIFGLGGAIRGAFLSAFNLPKEVYLATIGAIALFTDISRVISYYSGGVTLSGPFLSGLILFITVSFVGAKLAQKVVHKIPQHYFRLVIAAFLLVVGLKLIIF